jgi:hypothetical protein
MDWETSGYATSPTVEIVSRAGGARVPRNSRLSSSRPSARPNEHAYCQFVPGIVSVAPLQYNPSVSTEPTTAAPVTRRERAWPRWSKSPGSADRYLHEGPSSFGPSDFLLKPFGGGALVAAVTALLGAAHQVIDPPGRSGSRAFLHWRSSA